MTLQSYWSLSLRAGIERSDYEANLAALEDLIRTKSLDRSETMAVGDGANDLAMLGAAGLGGAFRERPY